MLSTAIEPPHLLGSPWCVSLPLVSEVLLLLLPWAGISFLTFYTGKAHSCFKVQLKCHFLRRVQATQGHVGQTGFSSLGFLCSYILSICPHEDKLRFRVSKLSQSYLSESYYLIYLLAASLQTWTVSFLKGGNYPTLVLIKESCPQEMNV